MNLIDKLKGFYSLIKRNPDEDYTIIVNDKLVQVSHPWWGNRSVYWKELQEVVLVNTDKGPWYPDVWLTLVGNCSTCKIPQAATGYDEVYNIVSAFEGFDFEKVIDSMSCTNNATFVLWKKTDNKVNE